MSIDVSSLTVETAISMAIQAEKDAAGLYEKLKGMVKNFVMRDKLDFLIGEEEKHQKILESLSSKMFPEKQPQPKKSLAPLFKLSVTEDHSVLDILQMAMDAEKYFEGFYTQLSMKVEERGAQEILQYLAGMELGHYTLLKAEFTLCQHDEMYFDRGDFEYDMVHIGP